MKPEIVPRYMTAKQAAAYLSISRNFFDNLVKQGKMPRPIQLAERAQRWDRLEIDKFVGDLKDEQSDNNSGTAG